MIQTLVVVCAYSSSSQLPLQTYTPKRAPSDLLSCPQSSLGAPTTYGEDFASEQKLSLCLGLCASQGSPEKQNQYKYIQIQMYIYIFKYK